MADKLIEQGAIAEKARMVVGGKVRGEIEFAEIGKGMSPYPFVLLVEQGRHEKLLYDFIKSNGRDVLWHTELENFSQDETGVKANVKNGERRNGNNRSEISGRLRRREKPGSPRARFEV